MTLSETFPQIGFSLKTACNNFIMFDFSEGLLISFFPSPVTFPPLVLFDGRGEKPPRQKGPLAEWKFSRLAILNKKYCVRRGIHTSPTEGRFNVQSSFLDRKNHHICQLYKNCWAAKGKESNDGTKKVDNFLRV